MSGEEYHFESRADAVASKTFTQQARTIRMGGYIVIENRPCWVVEVSTSGSGRYASCHFVAIDIFTREKFEYSVSSSHNCDVPHVNLTDYQLVDIPDDGVFVTLLTEEGSTKDDIKLPTDDSLRDQVPERYGKLLKQKYYSYRANIADINLVKQRRTNQTLPKLTKKTETN